MISSVDKEETLVFSPDFEKRGGLLPVIVQDYLSKEVLMLAYANKEALEKTLRTGLATFWSTSRNALWTKGESSGDFLQLKEMRVDCDQDALVWLVELQGQGVCHTFARTSNNANHRFSCFYRKLTTKSLEDDLEFLPGRE